MRRKQMICFLCTFVLAASICACSDTNEKGTQKENGTTNTIVNEESTTESQKDDEKSEEDVNVYYTPSEEIKNASITSGMIQVGNIVMKQGGYTTVGEFITTYGENLDTSFYDKKIQEYNNWWERDADESFRHVLELPIKNTDITLMVSYISPKTITPDKKTVWDSVIVDVYASSESQKTCMWYPGGVSSKEFSSSEEAVKWFANNGFTENNEFEYEKNKYLFLDINNPKTDINKYTKIQISATLSYVIAIIEADEVNLFGERPIMSFSVCDLKSDITVTYGNQIYLNSNNKWISELR